LWLGLGLGLGEDFWCSRGLRLSNRSLAQHSGKRQLSPVRPRLERTAGSAVAQMLFKLGEFGLVELAIGAPRQADRGEPAVEMALG
jgi:hypothetical protein